MPICWQNLYWDFGGFWRFLEVFGGFWDGLGGYLGLEEGDFEFLGALEKR